MNTRKRYLWDDYIGPALIVAAVVVGIIGVILGLVVVDRQIEHHYQQEACKSYAAHVDQPVEWWDQTFWNYGCYVYIDGLWVEKDNVWNGRDSK